MSGVAMVLLARGKFLTVGSARCLNFKSINDIVAHCACLDQRYKHKPVLAAARRRNQARPGADRAELSVALAPAPMTAA
jgi:hypothetical protein